MRHATQRFILTLATGLLSAQLSQPLFAQSLPAAQYSGMLGLQTISGGYVPVQITGPGAYAQNGVDFVGTPSYLNLLVTNIPEPSLSLSASVSAYDGTATANLFNSPTSATPIVSYSIEFNGPTQTVPIEIDSTLQANMSGISQTEGSTGYFTNQFVQADFSVLGSSGLQGAFSQGITLDPGTGNVYAITTNAPAAGGGSTTYAPGNILGTATTGFSGSLTGPNLWIAQTGIVYTVDLSLQNFTSIDSVIAPGATLQTSALIDPVFKISSSVANLSQYSILISDGIGNTAPAPEPSSSILMVLGLAMTSIATYSRRKKLTCDREETQSNSYPESGKYRERAMG